MDEDLYRVLKEFPLQRVLVAGDLMLDRNVHGEIRGVCPEAPVPALHVRAEVCSPGGAANVAANVASMGGKAAVVGVVGKDRAAGSLRRELDALQIDTKGLVCDPSRPTTQKTKLLARNQQLIRLDSEVAHPVDEDTTQELWEQFKNLLFDHGLVVLSDYRKGVLSRELVGRILSFCNERHTPVVADVKPGNLDLYKDAFLVSLNAAEAAEVLGQGAGDVFDGEYLVEAVGRRLGTRVLVTAGKEGLFFRDPQEGFFSVKAQRIDLVEPTGAGDSVTAAVALALAAGAKCPQAIRIGNYAGAYAVSKPGLAQPTLMDLQNVLTTQIGEQLRENIRVKQVVINEHVQDIEKIVRMIINTYRGKRKVLVFGNGGSAADAMHFAGELVGRFQIERRGLPAINLSADSSILTAVGNDYGFEAIFERQVEALARQGDVLIGLSTSGNSENVVRAMRKGKELGVRTISLVGKDGGKLRKVCDVSITVPSNNTPRIQETHITIIHIICDLLDQALFQMEGGWPDEG